MNIDRLLKMKCNIDIYSDTLDPFTGMRTLEQQLTDIPCRVENTTEEYIDSQGETRISKARIFLKQEVKPGDRIDEQEIHLVTKCLDVRCNFSHYEAML